MFELGIFSVINLLQISSQSPNITSCTFKKFGNLWYDAKAKIQSFVISEKCMATPNFPFKSQED